MALMSRLHFFGPDGALDRFPAAHELRRRCSMDPAEPFDEFVFSVLGASKRLWILDLHFDAVGVNALEIALNTSSVSEVRILSGQRTADLGLWLARLNAVRALIDPPLSPVTWLAVMDSKSYPFPHDRFAIIDDELWHFGHTVGGGGACLFACSGPWDAQSFEVEPFYEDLWLHFGGRSRR